MVGFSQTPVYPEPTFIKKNQCEECCQTKASVMCKTCNSQLCEGCFKKVHLPRTMKSHTPVPFFESVPWMVGECSYHPQEVCTLLCQTCSHEGSERFICVKCHILGTHQQHDAVELSYLNSLQLPMLKAAFSQVENMIMELQSQKNQCINLQAFLKRAEKTAMEKTHMLAEHLHGILQLREQSMLYNFHEAAKALHYDVATKRLTLENSISELLETSKKGVAAMDNHRDSYYGQRLLKELWNLLGEATKSDAEEGQNKEHQDEENEEEIDQEKTCRTETETVDDLAKRITSVFDVDSSLNALTEHLSASSAFLNDSPSHQSPQEAFGDYVGTLASEKEDVTTPKLQRPHSLPRQLQNVGSLISNLPLQLPERDKPFNPLCDVLPFVPKGNYDSPTTSTLVRDHSLGKQAPRGKGKRTGFPSDPLHALLLENDPGVSLRGGRANKYPRGQGRLQHFVDRPFRPVHPMPPPDTPVPSDMSDTEKSDRLFEYFSAETSLIPACSTDKEELGKPLKDSVPPADSSIPSDGSSDTVLDEGSKCHSKDFEEDMPKIEEPSPDMISHPGRGRKKEPLLKNPPTPQHPDCKLPSPPPITAFREQNNDSVLTPLPLLPKTEDSPIGPDMEFIKTVPPPPFSGSSMGDRAMSTSSLHSNASSNSTSLPIKKPLCFTDMAVEVTHIQTPSFFYIHTKDNIKTRVSFSHMVHRIGNKAKPLNKNPAEGDICLAQFTEDRKWYRVEVKKVIEKEEAALVTYVDYGNKDVLPLTRLRRCPAKLCVENKPALALACCLWEVEPARGKDWDMEAIQLFAMLVKNTKLQLFVINYDKVDNITKCQVELRRPSKTVGVSSDLPVSLREILVFLEYAVYINKSPEDAYNKKRLEAFRKNYHLPEIPFYELDTEVLLSSVTDPHNFSLQIKSSSEHLATLLDDIEKKYNNPMIRDCVDWTIYSPKIDMPCLAKCSGSTRWQRVRVQNLPGCQMVDVKFVDIGSTERLWYHQLYKIMDEFLVLPMQAIQCKLSGISPLGGSWTKQDTQRMISLCDVHKLKALFLACDEETCSVSLKVPGNTEEESLDVGQVLVKEGRALPIGPYVHSHELSKKTKQTATDHKDAAKSGSPSLLSSSLPFLALHTEMVKRPVAYMCLLEPFVYIHLLLQENLEPCKFFKEQLAKVCEREASEGSFQVGVGEECVVERSTDELTRAIVLRTLEQELEVLLIDSGGMEKVNPCNVYPMPVGMGRDTVTPFWQAVSLEGVMPPAGLPVWPGVTVDFLKAQFAIQNKFFVVPKGDPVWDESLQVKVLPVDLLYQKEVKGGAFEPHKITSVSINKELLRCGLALPVRSSSHAKKLTREECKEDPSRPASTSCVATGVEKVSLLTEETVLPPQDKKKNLVSPEKFEDEQGEEGLEKFSTSLTPKWLPPPLLTTLEFVAIPSYVDDHGCIFLQPQSNAATIDLIRESQTLLFNDTTPRDEDLCWQPGSPVVAKYHMDGKWYRASVIELKKNGNVEVTFIDYGNPELVEFKNIRTRLIHTSIPIQCYKARFHNVMPANKDGQWETRLLEVLHRTIVDHECVVTVMEEPRQGEVLEINLRLQTSGLDIATLLVEDMNACRRIVQPLDMKEVEEGEQTSRDVIIESDMSEEPLQGTPTSPPAPPGQPRPTSPSPSLSLPASSTPELLLPCGEIFPVRVTAIQDPAHIFISPATKLPPAFPHHTLPHYKKWAAQLSNLDEFVTRVNKNPEYLNAVTKPKVGDVCLACFSENQWVRAEILELTPTTVFLIYIDYGYMETMSRESIRECPLEAKMIPRCARLVQLSRVQPRGGPGAMWEIEAMEGMIDCLMGSVKQLFLASVVGVEADGMVEVDLFKMGSSQRPLKLAYSDVVERGVIALKDKN